MLPTSLIPFSHFSGDEYWALRYKKPEPVDGIFNWGEPQILRFTGRIQPISDLRNIRHNFGESVQAAIQISGPPASALHIEERDNENDYVYFRSQFWKVETSILYDRLLPHSEAQATLLTNPGEDKLKYAAFNLRVGAPGELLRVGEDRLVLGLVG